jgi:DNA-binding NtrC family response regulator
MKKASILVVDDEAEIRRVLQATLSSNGYESSKPGTVRRLFPQFFESIRT